MTKTALYRHYDTDGQLLYVGVSCDPDARFKSHCRTSPWARDVEETRVVWFGSRNGALRAEALAVMTEAPIHNKNLRGDPASEFYKIGERLKSLRIASGVSQAEFASEMGFKHTQYSNWENGFRRPSIAAAIVICEACGVTLDWLFLGKRSVDLAADCKRAATQ